MNIQPKFRNWTLLLLLLTIAAPLWAGPPFQTDDPEPVDFRHYEFYTFGIVASTPVETDPVGPAFEFNWGAVPNVQIHVVVPFGAIRPSNNPIYLPAGSGPSAYGLIDTELGVKYRFVKQTKDRPEIGSFTMLEVPTGNSSKGLGVGRVWYKLPVWLQKDWGHWTTYGGGGYQIVHQTDYRNFPYGGWLIQRDVGKKLQLAAEIFSHAHEGLATPQTQAASLIDIGGYYHFKQSGLQLLFAYGHSIVGQTENYAYLGLYKTWGSEKGGSKTGNQLHGFLSRHFSSL
jgi:hypothetical protein